MKIKGKTRQDFEKWAKDKNYELRCGDIIWGFYPEDFYKMPDSMQFGVLVDYFDSCGIEIDIRYTDYEINYGRNFANDFGFKSRPKAREKAIEKANEIRNKQLEQ